MKIIVMLTGFFLIPAISLQAQRDPRTYDSIAAMMQQADFMQEEIRDKNEPPPLTLRTLSADTMQSIARQDPYAYMQYIDSVLRARNAQAAPARRQPATTGPKRDWFSLALWIIALGAALFVLVQLLRHRMPLRKESSPGRQPPGPSEIIPVGMHNRLIEDAIAQGDFRGAIRYLFIDALNALAAAGHVQLMTEKTNHQYLAEIADPSLREAFQPLVMHYEYTWYGEFNPGEQQFNSILSSFHTFRNTWF
ncbi:MAG: DUF4129 domain-containing protein [Chitinophagaceae bacterium]|nr:DUF4129 domain-containing protein [Chitinophagaceae bacterium]